MKVARCSSGNSTANIHIEDRRPGEEDDEVRKWFIGTGAAGIHIEDQKPSAKS